MSRHAVRKTVARLHEITGLSVGLVFAIISLSGSLLVFYPQIDLWLNPQIQPQAPSATASIDADRALQVLQQTNRERHGSWRLEMPLNGQPLNARYMKPAETAGTGFAPMLVSIDPVSYEITSQRFWGDTLMTWLYDLHFTLLMKQSGATLAAVCGLIALFISLSGLYLWWPKGKSNSEKWRKALSFKRHAHPIRRIYDLHTRPGVYSLIVVVMLCLTGAMLERPQWFSPALEQISPRTAMPAVNSLPPANAWKSDQPAQRIAAQQAAAIALNEFPTAELRWLQTPADYLDTYSFRLYQPGEPSRRFPHTRVWVDQYSGRVLATINPLAASASDTIFNWLHALHSGEAFGLFGRWLVFICGLIPPLLFVTGLMRWIDKRLVTKRERKRA
ncbi:MAG: hypothetical protein CMI03_03855 [Oceanospirillaceae bacterium]|uniref:PepSY-associated TM helix domain-containing protein n=1 Tax=unclassified Thalassolituus TaxID=2624967 RepID=UPI000C67D07A|nr:MULTISPECIES: PepSY-associated TM helix domain-containing protein [unclassified Thalassolituus]MAS25819.1 hypothetical protein [Oceanospirillaceae bacterium]MBL35448.1 hypothetical protein [Oceanospirillaceae bacterium]MBS51869.1 hypothetical protein [Oceanospirillaceae bacterium]|tara:strand:- start:15568 stop:16734 length:1167 start_codon:yes stop_codon:yes gene_type:complete